MTHDNQENLDEEAEPRTPSTPNSWREMAEKHGHSLEEVKELLPIEWVVAIAADVRLEENGEGRSIGLCPFHDDNNPSLDVYGNGERWGCFACTRGGDVFDFIGEYWELASFGARFEKSLELLQSYKAEAEDWHSIIARAEPAQPVTVAELAAEVQASLDVVEHQTTKPIRDLLDKKGLGSIDLDWIRKQWRLGVTMGGEVLAPYWDREGKLVSLKTRTPQRGGWFTRRGTKLTSLYGEHQLAGKDAEADVWICEGETDTWLASWLLRGRGIALGLPAGAGSRISDEWVELMRDRRVNLIMDADKAGRAAAMRWWTQIHSVAREVLISFPESDLCDSKDPMAVLEAGMLVTEESGFVMERADHRGYMQMTRAGGGQPGEMISNWVFRPTKHIQYLDTHGMPVMDGFEGYFADETRRKVRVSALDFRGAQSLQEWANKNGRVWYGSNRKHVQAVLDTLKSQIPFLKREVAVSVAGLWGEDTAYPVFVLPDEAGGVIGSAQGAEAWSYDGGFSHVEIGSRYWLVDRPGAGMDEEQARACIKALLTLNASDVMTPLIAWLTAAPLRKLLSEFPPMAILGDSGSGKTVMTMAVMRLVYGWRGPEQNLTRTTPHGVIMQSSSTNGLPVWWDEYRRGGRQDTFRAMSQLIRDSWTGSVSQRGGLGDNFSKIEQTAAIAPLLLSGEAAMEERSTIDRVVAIRLSKGGVGDKRSEAALESVLDQIGNGMGGALGRRLIEWQLANLDRLRAAIPAVRDRQDHGVAVLAWGWDMFREFVMEEWNIEVTWDLDSQRVDAQREDADENPEISALLEAVALGAHERSDDPVPVAWEEKDTDGNSSGIVAFRPRAFYQWAYARGYALPGGERATKQMLMDHYGWLTNDKATYTAFAGVGGRHRVEAVRLQGVITSDNAVYRQMQIDALEASMEEPE